MKLDGDTGLVIALAPGILRIVGYSSVNEFQEEDIDLSMIKREEGAR